MEPPGWFQVQWRLEKTALAQQMRVDEVAGTSFVV